MQQLVWKLLLCVAAIVVTFQICDCKAKNLPHDDEHGFDKERTEVDISKTKALDEAWDFKQPSGALTIRDFDEGKRKLAEAAALNYFIHRGWHGRIRRQAGDHLPMYPLRADQLDEAVQIAIMSNLYFYIGYTSQGSNSYYLKKTTPKSIAWQDNFQKQATCYANIAGTTVTERWLIDRYIGNPLCVNMCRGNTEHHGIVYVLFGQQRI